MHFSGPSAVRCCVFVVSSVKRLIQSRKSYVKMIRSSLNKPKTRPVSTIMTAHDGTYMAESLPQYNIHFMKLSSRFGTVCWQWTLMAKTSIVPYFFPLPVIQFNWMRLRSYLTVWHFQRRSAQRNQKQHVRTQGERRQPRCVHWVQNKGMQV